MKQYTLLIILILCFKIHAQENTLDIKEFILGDWSYYIENPNLKSDSIYSEIYFDGRFVQMNNLETGYEKESYYSIKSGKIYFYADSSLKNSPVFEARLLIDGKNNLVLLGDSRNFYLMRIDTAEYTFSKHQKMLQEIERQNQSKRIKDSLFTIEANKYSLNFQHREIEADFEFGKINSQEAINRLQSLRNLGDSDLISEWIREFNNKR